MLDIKFIRENQEAVKTAIKNKQVDLDLDRLLDLDGQRRTLLTELENLHATKNQTSRELPNLSEAEKKTKLLEMKEVDERQEQVKKQLKAVTAEYDRLMFLVPNLPSRETPVGSSEADNVPWRYWSPKTGQVDPKDEAKVKAVPTTFTFEPKDHVTLGTTLDLIDTEAGVKTAGFRGYYLKNEAVLMHYGILWHALKKLEQKGFMLMAPPVLARSFAFFGSGHFPFGKADQYQVLTEDEISGKTSEPTYLSGTSEPNLLAYFSDRTLEEKDLPIKLCGISPCFRGEVGSYGKDTRGIYRVHEFMKVEQVVICKADIAEADRWLETLREIAQEVLEDLKLPYRVLNICTADMGAGKYKMYDIETWMPSKGTYGETHSDSNLTDWQARRLNIRYRGSDGKTRFAYTLNNTAVASPRILIAILENYQQADGSVVVPEVLRPYVGKDILKAKTA